MIFLLLACMANGTRPSDGWQEIPAPRSDLQCWSWFNGQVVCAQSLTATHGAAL